MFKPVKAFIPILLIELEDLRHELQESIEIYNSEYAENSISSYVRNENVALLHNELFGIERFEERIRQFHAGDITTVEDLIVELKNQLFGLCKHLGIALSLSCRIEDRMQKVKFYVYHKPEPVFA